MDYDVIVIGAGPGGVETARILGRNKQKVALVDYREIGGTCLNRGCIPAKTMLYCADLFRGAQSLLEYGIDIHGTQPSLDFEKMISKRSEIMTKIRAGYTRITKNDGVDFIEGFANFLDANTVEVAGKQYTAGKFVLATGANALTFPGFVKEDPRFLIADNIFELKQMPESILIVGAGPVGVEFASFFNAFGVQVTILDAAESFLNFYDSDLGKTLIAEFNKQGIQTYTQTLLEEIDSSDPSILKAKLSNGQTIQVQNVLSAIGLLPDLDYTKALDLEAEKRRLLVNENYQTKHAHIYAIGDVIGLSGSAYGAEREGLFVAHHILGEYADYYKVPYEHFPDPVFTYPEIATVGYSCEQLDELGVDYTTAKSFYLANPKAFLAGKTQGFCKIIADSKTGELLGAHIIGLHATEIVHMLTIPVMQRMKISDLRRMVYGHPVAMEVVKDAVVECYKKMSS